MFADNARAHQGGELDDGPTLRILPGQLKELYALPGDRILPDFTDPDRRKVRRGIGSWMGHDRTLPPPLYGTQQARTALRRSLDAGCLLVTAGRYR
jgi:hypothetical protein